MIFVVLYPSNVVSYSQLRRPIKLIVVFSIDFDFVLRAILNRESKTAIYTYCVGTRNITALHSTWYNESVDHDLLIELNIAVQYVYAWPMRT